MEPTSILSAIVGAQDANCFNTSDGFAVAAGIGGTAPYTYQWDAFAASQTNDTAFNLAARTYGVTITDSFNCSFDTTVAVSQPSAPLTVNMFASPVLCFSGGDGQAHITISGGSAPYSILWGISAGSQTNDTAFGLISGYHTISVLDKNNCGVFDSVYVGGPAEPLELNTFKIDVSCHEGTDGIAIAEGSGGTAPYIFVWDGNAGNQINDTAFNLGAGTYSVTLTDTNNCDTTLSVTINEPTLLEDSVYISLRYNGSAIKCFGDSNGAATAVGYGGTAPYSYLWDNKTGNQTTATATNLGEGVYNVQITDTNGCTRLGVISVASPERMAFKINGISNISCFGGNDGVVSLGGIGGTRPFRYRKDLGPVTTDSIFDSLIAKTYQFRLIDTNGCTYDSSITLSEPPALNIDTLIHTNAICYNQASGTATIIISGGTTPYNYLWQIAPGIFQITSTAINLSAGSYPVTVKDKNDCIIRDTVTIDQPTQVKVSTSVNDTICALQNVTLLASGSGGDSLFYRYIWLPPRADSLAFQAVNPSNTTNYGVRAMDAKGCLSLPKLITIFVRTMDEDTIDVTSAGDICEGDTTSVFGFHNGPFGNYTYTWNINKNGFGPYFVSPDSARYYVMTAHDICGNSITDSALVQVFPNPDFYLDSIIAEGCNPLEVQFDDTVNAPPNFSYVWQFGDGNGSTQKNPTYTFEKAGTYNITMTVTSGNNCSSNNKSKPSLVIVHPTPEPDFKANPVVADMRNPLVKFSNLTDGNIIRYNWQFGDGDSAAIISPSHLYGDTGTYKVVLIVTSDKGCEAELVREIIIKAYYDISIPSAFTPSSSSNGGNWRRDPDGNLVFYPYTEKPEAVVDYNLIVFNRWGELIFESKNIYIGWDGFYRGKASPQEVYVYKVSVTFENGQTFEKMGDVTLFR
jgi:gliding motility-associated-like protein